MTDDRTIRRVGTFAAGMALVWFLGSLLVGRSLFTAVLCGLAAAALGAVVFVAVAAFRVSSGRSEPR